MINELSDLAAEQNEFILDENQKPLVNLNLCDENLSSMNHMNVFNTLSKWT